MHSRSRTASQAKVEQPMTPLIDVVFQLLVFFVLSFKVVGVEGDFSVKMPRGERTGTVHELPSAPLKLRLVADSAGQLARIYLNQREFPAADWPVLQRHLLELLGNDSRPGSMRPELEVEIDSDYHLHYQHAMDAVSAVSGIRGDDGHIVPLIERIKLSPPRTG